MDSLKSTKRCKIIFRPPASECVKSITISKEPVAENFIHHEENRPVSADCRCRGLGSSSEGSAACSVARSTSRQNRHVPVQGPERPGGQSRSGRQETGGNAEGRSGSLEHHDGAARSCDLWILLRRGRGSPDRSDESAHRSQ